MIACMCVMSCVANREIRRANYPKEPGSELHDETTLTSQSLIMKTATRTNERTMRDEIVGRGPLSSPYLHLSLPSWDPGMQAPKPVGGTVILQLEIIY